MATFKIKRLSEPGEAIQVEQMKLQRAVLTNIQDQAENQAEKEKLQARLQMQSQRLNQDRDEQVLRSQIQMKKIQEQSNQGIQPHLVKTKTKVIPAK